MIRLTSLSLKFRRRTIRPLYVHTQGTPYSVQLSSSFDRTAGQLAGGGAITGSKAAIQAGSVMLKTVGETVTLSGATDTERAWGLAAQAVGGQLDELGDLSEMGVWRGVGSTYLLLAPAFDDTNLATPAGEEDGSDEEEVYLSSTSTGVLGVVTEANGYAIGNTARLVARQSANSIKVELLV